MSYTQPGHHLYQTYHHILNPKFHCDKLQLCPRLEFCRLRGEALLLKVYKVGYFFLLFHLIITFRVFYVWNWLMSPYFIPSNGVKLLIKDNILTTWYSNVVPMVTNCFTPTIKWTRANVFFVSITCHTTHPNIPKTEAKLLTRENFRCSAKKRKSFLWTLFSQISIWSIPLENLGLFVKPYIRFQCPHSFHSVFYHVAVRMKLYFSLNKSLKKMQ